MFKADFVVVGAGLAGCECALALARQGYNVNLYEQKPKFKSAAHVSDNLAELVCSNSFRSDERGSGIGLLKNEMRALGSAVMSASICCRVPAGKALAVDREAFSAEMTARIAAERRIRLIHEKVDSLDEPRLYDSSSRKCAICAGPLLSDKLAASLAEICGQEYCYFYDAIAPIIWTDTVNMEIAFRASRYEDSSENGDYINCPMTKEEYQRFYVELCAGETFSSHMPEKHFEGCMPIEALAERGEKTLTFGPMKPVGLKDPHSGQRPWAVLQLRPEKANLETCNLVGCQTKLTHAEQERIFRLIPGMENAEFVRYGSMHRNSFLNAPELLNANLSLRKRASVYCAGQLTGVEGYVESAACGLWLGLVLGAEARGESLASPPEESALGALLAHLRRKNKNFQPSNAHFGLMPEFEIKLSKKIRKEKYAERAEKSFQDWLRRNKTVD